MATRVSALVCVQITIEMQTGVYAGGRFSFKIDVPHSYPFSPPQVHCTSRVWHPNICLRTGRVSLSILDEDWKPVISLNTVVFGLQLLFLEPNADLSVNNEATAALLKGPEVLARQVRQTFRGGLFGGFAFSAQKMGLRRPSPERRKRSGTMKRKSFGVDRESDDEEAISSLQYMTIEEHSEQSTHTRKRPKLIIAGLVPSDPDGMLLSESVLR